MSLPRPEDDEIEPAAADFSRFKMNSEVRKKSLKEAMEPARIKRIKIQKYGEVDSLLEIEPGDAKAKLL